MIDRKVQGLLEELMGIVADLDQNLDRLLGLLKGRDIERPILTDGPKVVTCKCGFRIALLHSKQAAFFAMRHQDVCREQTVIVPLVQSRHSILD